MPQSLSLFILLLLSFFSFSGVQASTATEPLQPVNTLKSALNTHKKSSLTSDHLHSTHLQPTTLALSSLTTTSLTPRVIGKESHDNKWFTQGLYQDNNAFYISSGLYGQSVLIYQRPGKNLRYFLPSKYFAEGLTVIGDKLFLLTWKEETVLVFDKNTLSLVNQFSYKGEGWGLTHNEASFIMSDGSHTLQFRDKDSFKLQYTVNVEAIDKINELEYIDGIIWANRWHDDKIYAINSQNGCIMTSINLIDLRLASVEPNNNNIANGIAYDRQKKGLWVTGKYWNHRFLIDLPQLDKTQCKIK